MMLKRKNNLRQKESFCCKSNILFNLVRSLKHYMPTIQQSAMQPQITINQH